MKRHTAGIAAGLLAVSTAPLAAQVPASPAQVPTAQTPAAQTPAAQTPAAQTPAAQTPAAQTPAAQTPAAQTPTRTYTLDQVLAIALGNNSSVRLAQEKVLKAQQLILEANAGGLPSIRVDIVDTLSGNKTFGTAAGGSNATGTLPGGGAIPVIIDTGGGNATGVVSSGGGGTATGAGATSTGTTTTNTTTTTGATTTNSSPTNTTLGGGGTSGTGSGTGTTGTGTTGTGTTGTGTTGTGTSGTGTGGTGTTGTGTGTTGAGSTGTFGTTGPTSQIRSSSADLPPIMQRYSQAAGPGTGTAQKLSPRDTTGTGTGTGQQPGNGSLNNGTGGHNNNYSARLSLTQGIDIFNLVPAAQDVERFTRDFYVTDLERVQNETALSVKDQYFNVLRDQQQVTVDQQQVTADQESVRVTQARVTAGAAAEFDLLTAQTTLSNAQQVLSSARNTLTLAQVNLNNLLGLDADTLLSLQVPAVPPLTQTFDKLALTRFAYTRRPELRQADNNIRIAQRLVKLAGVGLLPSLSLVGAGNYNGYIVTGSHSTVSLSAVLGVPLYDGGTTQAKIREAQSDLRSQKITQGQLQENVAIEVRQALSNINDAQTRASSAGLGAQQAAEAYRLARVRYQNGIGTILDVVNAQAQLAQARSNLLNAQFDYQTSLAQLTRALGGR